MKDNGDKDITDEGSMAKLHRYADISMNIVGDNIRTAYNQAYYISKDAREQMKLPVEE